MKKGEILHKLENFQRLFNELPNQRLHANLAFSNTYEAAAAIDELMKDGSDFLLMLDIGAAELESREEQGKEHDKMETFIDDHYDELRCEQHTTKEELIENLRSVIASMEEDQESGEREGIYETPDEPRQDIAKLNELLTMLEGGTI